ncbi:hypothetical protein AKJ09_10017 [Labilithrix luteola]|uniref:Tetratricopeptide repeat protein n=1 Tax=Labilithrix luteola TaxID=1391654 RepID=A0A0K1QC79_9BACT|nr:tetratricopeptide repeat protein [Labilithrix luteola]AKV03354.1 hypothetical protein AKJ09_10017 [Labilithrix luteola]
MTAARADWCSRLSIGFVLASLVAAPAVAHADGSPNTGRAEAAYREGRTLLEAKRYDEACPKLAESQKLDPGAGTLLALALCHEGQGKTATAWAELNEAARIGKKVGRSDLANAAQKRAQAMEPSLAKLVVRVPQASDDLAITCDGNPVAATDLGSPFPVDPGEHKVEASAPGKVARSYTVRLSGAGVVEIVVDKLDDAHEATPAPATKPVSTTQTTSAEYDDPVHDSSPNRGGAQRTVGLLLVGAGIIGVGAGAYFVGKGLSESSEARRTCPTTPCESQTDANDRAKDSMKTSVIAFTAGTVAVAAGTIVYLLAPSTSSSSRQTGQAPKPVARVVPHAGPSELGLGVVGSF